MSKPRLTIEIDKDIRELYSKKCEKNGTNMKDALTKHILSEILFDYVKTGMKVKVLCDNIQHLNKDEITTVGSVNHNISFTVNNGLNIISRDLFLDCFEILKYQIGDIVSINTSKIKNKKSKLYLDGNSVKYEITDIDEFGYKIRNINNETGSYHYISYKQILNF